MNRVLFFALLRVSLATTTVAVLPVGADSAESPAACDLRAVVQVAAGQPLGQCRIVPLSLGAGQPKAFLAVYAEDVTVDPFEEMFFFPKDTLHLMAFTEKGEVLWKHDLGRGVVPGIWFCPVFPFDLDSDGADEVWLVGNPDVDHPLTVIKRRLERLDSRTGKVLGHWPWPPADRYQSPSYIYRNFILGGHVRGKPVLVTAQGTYQAMALQGWNADMTRRWEVRIAKDAPGARGSHMCPVVDINDDGVDELLWGERCIELDGGKELFCADRDTWHAHSDVVQPVWNPIERRWLIYTCREGTPNVAPRVVVYDDRGQRVWGDLDKGHIDAGWVARVGGNERMAFAIRIGGKSAGPQGLVRRDVEEFVYDVFTGKPRTFPVNLLGTIPVDLNGDGIHELADGSSSGEGRVFDMQGRPCGRFTGAVAAASKVLDLPGEQLMTYTREGTITIWADANAKDNEAAQWRYRHPFYKANQRLTATGSNRNNLGGL
ncbi:MAG: polysaccharide lyase 11 [Candidatus Sumerlaeia bacterium]|nr:polysaccharide lyase 11 [Candidatus Sumerlaeia bacterium]